MADFAQQLKARCSYLFQRVKSFSFGNNKENKEIESSTVASLQPSSAVTQMTREINFAEEKRLTSYHSPPKTPEHN